MTTPQEPDADRASLAWLPIFDELTEEGTGLKLEAERPMIDAGDGIGRGGAVAELVHVAELLGARGQGTEPRAAELPVRPTIRCVRA